MKTRFVSAVVFRDLHGRVLTIRRKGTEIFVLPNGTIAAEEDPAPAARRVTHETIRASIDADALTHLGTFEAESAEFSGDRIRAHVFIYPETIAVAHPTQDISELAWVDPAAPGVPLAPLLSEHVFLSEKL